ncbi:PAS domain S-box protein, partial [bacterium]|nr:PAS domain S-box protein [bacterium]
DISERKQTEITLQNQTDFMVSLLQSIPIPIFYKDKELRYLGCNPAFESITGKFYSQIVGKTVFELWNEKFGTIYSDADKQLIENPGVQTYESQYELPDGRVRDVLFNKSTFFDQKGEVAGLIGTMLDITAKNEAEKVIRESEQYTRNILDSLPSHIAIVNQEGIIESVNQAWRNFADENPPIHDNVCEGANYFAACEHASDEDREQALAFSQAIQQVLTGQIDSFQMEYPCHSPDRQRWFIGRITPLQPDRSNRVVISHENITDRKLAEAALRESRHLLTEAERLAGLGAWKWDVKKNQFKMSDNWFVIHGCPKKSYALEELIPLVHSEDRDKVQQTLQDVLAGKGPYQIEHRIIHQETNQVRYVQAWGEAQWGEQDEITHVIGTSMDITQRKQAEKELYEATMREMQVVKATNVGLWDWDLETDKVHFSAQWKKQIGYEDHEIGNDFNEWQSRVHPDDLEPTLKQINTKIAEASPHYQAEFRFRHKNGSYLWILVHASIITDETGRPVRVMGSHMDITERKRLEEREQETLARLQLAMESANEGVWEWDFETGLVTFDKLALGMIGYDSLIPAKPGEWWISQIHPDDRQFAEKAYSSFLSGHSNTYSMEFRLKRNDGNYTWVASNATIFRWDREGRPLLVVGIHRDITERKNKEELIENLAKFPSENPNPVLRCSSDGKLIYANSPGARFLQQEGCQVGDELPPMLKNPVIDSFTSNQKHEIETLMSESVFSFVLSPVKEMGYVNAYGADITMRKNAEDELRRSEQRLNEAQRIARLGDFTWDIETGEVTWSEAMYDLLQYNKSEKIDLNKINTEFHHPDDLERITQWMNECLASESEELIPNEYRILRADGNPLHIRIMGKIERKEGKAIRVFATIQDIT